MAGRRRLALGCLAVFIVAGAVVAFVFGPALADLNRAGFNPLEKTEKRTWNPNTQKNLQALHTALKLHHESEGAFPKASAWMDAALKRVANEQLAKEEARKKFVDPEAGGAPGAYGFAFNDAASGKYLEDLPQKGKTPLLFQSTRTDWNAHGDPARIARPGGMTILADGSITNLPVGDKPSGRR